MLKRAVLQQRALGTPGREGVEIAGQAPQTLKPGDVFFIPANTPHMARNSGSTPRKIIGMFFVEAGKPLGARWVPWSAGSSAPQSQRNSR